MPPPGDHLPGGTPVVVGLAGGTGSGKTTVTARLVELLGPDPVAVVALDSYYRDGSRLEPEARAAVDYDHPDAFDWELLLDHVRALGRRCAVDSPCYDFTRHVRSDVSHRIDPAAVVVVEGILALHHHELRALFDLAVFVDVDADVRFIRRLRRDVEQRGRTADGVITQYLTTVRPAHLQFVEPSRRHADVIVPNDGPRHAVVDMLAAHVRQLVAGRQPGPAASTASSP